jgi:hypothetical protein
MTEFLHELVRQQERKREETTFVLFSSATYVAMAEEAMGREKDVIEQDEKTSQRKSTK